MNFCDSISSAKSSLMSISLLLENYANWTFEVKFPNPKSEIIKLPRHERHDSHSSWWDKSIFAANLQHLQSELCATTKHLFPHSNANNINLPRTKSRWLFHKLMMVHEMNKLFCFATHPRSTIFSTVCRCAPFSAARLVKSERVLGERTS